MVVLSLVNGECVGCSIVLHVEVHAFDEDQAFLGSMHVSKLSCVTLILCKL